MEFSVGWLGGGYAGDQSGKPVKVTYLRSRAPLWHFIPVYNARARARAATGTGASLIEA